MPVDRALEDLLRQLAPQVLGALVRRYGQFDACEDATQEALIAASAQWPTEGLPDNPRGWLLTIASRRLIDEWRSESARRRREEAVVDDRAQRAFTGPMVTTPAGIGVPSIAAALDDPDRDDTLALLLLCCHPSLSAPSQLALTLRAVGGLTTAQIASAFLVPEATMAQRISRAKQSIRTAGARFELPADTELRSRIDVVMHVLYLIFNEGYFASSGDSLQRADLTAEAIRLSRMLLAAVPDDREAGGLLALMLLTDARSRARQRDDGTLVPLAEQDRTLWRADRIEEGVALLTATLGRGRVGQYQLQAAIAAVHDEAASDAETDWRQILALYRTLDMVAPSPVVTLNRAVAVANVDGPQAGLELLNELEVTGGLAESHRLDAVRAHLLERIGDLAGARDHYLRAALTTRSAQERDYLTLKAAAITAS